MDLEEKFIESVKKYPCIWNVDLPSHKCADTKDRAWTNIVEETNLPDVKTAIGKWKRITDSLRKALQRQNDSKQNGAKVKHPLKYQQALNFILPYMTNCQEQSLDELLAEISTNKQDKNGTGTPTTSTSQGVTRNTNDELDHLTQDPKRARPDDSEDSIEKFFMVMAENTKKLPQFLQLQVKRNVFNAVIEAEEIVLQLSSRNRGIKQENTHDEYEHNISLHSHISIIPSEFEDIKHPRDPISPEE